ncbi:ABC-type transporter ATP-binding protein EcsA [Lachnospiraceae bacterium]|jgi:ABC-2 type transport system ATP-binding protein|nr:ABC-type transporter ATP-binding protein EcsA [Lachnospiraceae bacterium]
MLEIKQISFSYEKTRDRTVNNLNIKLNPGDICALLGPNGAGKTTTIKLILGLLKADEGTIEIKGVDIYENVLKFKSSIGYVSDNHEIYDNLTGIEYLNFIADAYGVSLKDRKNIYQELLPLFKMEKNVNNKIRSYSHGMKQKIAIIASLVHTPDLWILDEPMTGLDIESNFVLKNLIKAHAAKGKVVLFSTHILEVCERLCNKIIIIKNGRVIYQEYVHENEEYKIKNLEEIFLEMTDDENTL